MQNIHNKDLIIQNLESIGLTGQSLTANVLADIAGSASSAGAMMERIRGCGQGRMSQGTVEIFVNYDLGLPTDSYRGFGVPFF